ncbi:MFS transporter [Streptomyces sp. I05A-00742]|uniref:MFS transporter n=1 Tax=Streptomyces sp. I05A-00742 TaxID=2732853 RepID=UPI002017310C|nr:MFS transporter [Streptomyces sp. I05A-00742]
MATILLAVLDQNIVSAVTVPIARELDPVHGIDRIPWLVSSFSLAATAALPLYGKLCDTLGAKRIFLGAVGTFLLGSALCGAAQSMGQLIAFRAVQGLGGGGLMSVTMVVLAQLPRPGAEVGGGRGFAGIGGIIAGAGMALGPVLGGLLADTADWRWVFYVNLPIGLVVLALATVLIRIPHRTNRRRVDFLGAALAAAFSTALLLIAEWGGKEHAWGSPTVLGLITAAVALLGLFVLRQATAAEPVLPLSLFRNRVLLNSFVVQGITGMAMLGSMVYIIIYLQVARDIAATSASLFMIPMAAGLSGVGLLSGRLTRRGWSRRTFVVSGTGCAAAALGALALTGPATSLWLIGAELLLLGVGFGQLLGQLVQLVQETAPRDQLGVATTAIRFFQSLGGALGTALFGTVVARVYESRMPGGSTSRIRGLEGAEHARAVEVFVTSVDVVFACAAAAMLVALVLATRLPLPAPVAADADAEGSGAVGAASPGDRISGEEEGVGAGRAASPSGPAPASTSTPASDR